MILAEVLNAKISAAENENNVAIRSEALFRTQSSSQGARCRWFGQDLSALKKNLERLYCLLIRNDSHSDEVLLRHRKSARRD